MAITPILAMTAAEIQFSKALPPKIAWMSCHFSLSGPGLSNLPKDLPSGSILILDDSTPFCSHDPALIAGQLGTLIDDFQCAGLLLDFQRPGNPEIPEFTQFLANALPCPVALSDPYAEKASLPVFLSPAPPSVGLKDHLAPWAGRDIWLDISPNPELLLLRTAGCERIPLPPGFRVPESRLADPALHCHYHILPAEDAMEFTLWRAKEDLEALCLESQALGVTGVIGLYQELKQWDKE